MENHLCFVHDIYFFTAENQIKLIHLQLWQVGQNT